MITLKIRLASPADILAIAQHYDPTIETFEQCRNASFSIALPSNDPEVPPKAIKAMMAMPTYLGVQGGCPDEDAAPVEKSYQDEAGETVTYFERPLKVQGNGEPWRSVDILWTGTAEELALVQLPALEGTAVSPATPFMQIAA